MFELKPTARVNWSFEILEDGRAVGMLDFRMLRTAGTLTIEGQTYQITRDGLFGAFRFNANGREVARAERAALLGARYRITAEDRQLLLSAKGFLQRVAQLHHGDVAIATISRTSFFRRAVHVEAMPGAPLPLVMFAASLMVLFWRHQSRSSS